MQKLTDCVNIGKRSGKPSLHFNKLMFLGALHPKSPAEVLRTPPPPTAPLMLATLPFLLIMFPIGFYDIHPGHKQMA